MVGVDKLIEAVCVCHIIACCFVCAYVVWKVYTKNGGRC